MGVSCSETAVYNEAGLDVAALRAHVAAGGLLKDFPGGNGEQGGVMAYWGHGLVSGVGLS